MSCPARYDGAGCCGYPELCANPSDSAEHVGTVEDMSTDNTPTKEALYGFARFKRSISDGNYGSLEASISLPFIVVLEDDTATELNAKVAFIQGKTAVCRELGIETKVLDDGTVMELLDPKATVVERPAQQRSSAPSDGGGGQRQQGGGGGQGIKVFKRLEDPRGGTNDRGKPNTIENPSWLADQIAAAVASGKPVSNELWDNRRFLPQFGGTGNAKAPWFKDKNGDNAIWPPKGAPECDASWRHPAFQDGNYEEPF